MAWQQHTLTLTLPPGAGASLSELLPKVRRLFDLDCDPQAVDAHLLADPRMVSLMAQVRGLRVPGAWNGYETAVRALLGQQVSVARAPTLRRP